MITSAAKRELHRLSDPDLDEINRVFSELCENPYAGDVKFLRGQQGALRRRVGAWRIFYDLHQEDKLIVITGVKRRGSHTY